MLDKLKTSSGSTLRSVSLIPTELPIPYDANEMPGALILGTDGKIYFSTFDIRNEQYEWGGALSSSPDGTILVNIDKTAVGNLGLAIAGNIPPTDPIPTTTLPGKIILLPAIEPWSAEDTGSLVRIVGRYDFGSQVISDTDLTYRSANENVASVRANPGSYTPGVGDIWESSKFKGTIDGTTLTVTEFISGVPLRVGLRIGLGPTSSSITALGTGTGGVGTYTLAGSYTIPTESTFEACSRPSSLLLLTTAKDSGTTRRLVMSSEGTIDFNDVLGNNRVRLSSTGNLLVGNTTGVEKLSVTGNIQLTNTANSFMVGTNNVVGSRKIGWTAATGTATRTTFVTSTVTTEQLAQRVKGLIDDLISHGLIGA